MLVVCIVGPFTAILKRPSIALLFHTTRCLLETRTLAHAGRLFLPLTLGRPIAEYRTGQLVEHEVCTCHSLSGFDHYSILDPGQMPGIKGVTK